MTSKLTSRQLALLCARVLDDTLATDITILDMTTVMPLTDYFVLATGTSRRHLRTCVEAVEEAMEAQGERKIGLEGTGDYTWVLIDYVDVVVHVFEPQTRQFYDLELLWGDADRVPWQDVSTTTG